MFQEKNNNHKKHLKEKNKQNLLTKQIDSFAIKNGKSSKSSTLMSLKIGKGDCIIKGLKMESKTSLSPSNAKM